MLERPDLPDALIVDSLEQKYGLVVSEVAFLPLGADANTAVYRAHAPGGQAYFVKLRSGAFDENAVLVPKFLHGMGLRPIIAPIVSQSGRPWEDMDGYRLSLYPFVDGRDGYQVALSERQWRELGATVRRIHDAAVPDDLAVRIPREGFAPRWRDATRHFLDLAGRERFADPVAAELAAFLRDRRPEVLTLIDRAGRYAARLRAEPREFVLCHSDLHAGNLLIDGERFYIVDWDEPIFAPRERDLMFFGGALGFLGRSPEEEEALFRSGYGSYDVDPVALAYYRFERIVVDIAAFCEALLLSDEGGADREQSLRYVKFNFLPGNTIDRAYAAAATIDSESAINPGEP